MKNKQVDEYGHIVDEEDNVIDENGRVWEKDDSWYRIGLFELTCGLNSDSKIKVPSFCRYGAGKPGDYCLENLCTHICTCAVPLTIAYTNKHGYAESIEGFAEGIYLDDDIDKKMKNRLKIWEEICCKKIDEAYEEYEQKSISELET